MPVANYLECGSELKVKVHLAYPLSASLGSEPANTRERDEVRKMGECESIFLCRPKKRQPKS